MNLNQIAQRLQNLTNLKISQAEIGRALDIERSSVNMRIKRETEVKLSDIQKLADYFRVNLSDLTGLKDIENVSLLEQEELEETYLMDYYPEVFGSCGSGVFELSQEKEQIRVSKNALFSQISPIKRYSVINAYGNSMFPFICDADKLIVEHWEGEQIIDNRIYVFVYDKEIFVKRLVKNINQLVIMSDNKEYDTIKLTGKDLEKIHIIGQIVGLMRNTK